MHANFAVHVFSACLLLGVGATIENPSTSWFFKLPRCLQLLKHEKVSMVTSDHCMEGTPWRKRTAVMLTHAYLEPMSRICRLTGGVCDRSSGQFYTLHAQEYPASLRRMWLH